MLNINFQKYKKIIIISIVLFIIVISTGIYLVHASSIPEETIEINELEKEPIIKNEDKQTEVDTNKILIDIKGAVVNPGVYQLSVGCSVMDAINMAGGLLEDANTNTINLSKRLVDEMVIIIYTNEQIENYNKEKVITEFVYVEIPCECPDTMNDACIEDNNTNNIKEDKISINNATKEELMTLSGIGASKAEGIIKYRETNGNFTDITEIKNVSGIGESAFEKIKDNITL